MRSRVPLLPLTTGMAHLRLQAPGITKLRMWPNTSVDDTIMLQYQKIGYLSDFDNSGSTRGVIYLVSQE